MPSVFFFLLLPAQGIPQILLSFPLCAAAGFTLQLALFLL